MDVLSGGPERARPPRRRWVAVLATVAVAGAATVLAARSTPDRPVVLPTPAPAPLPATVPLPPTVVSVAVGTRYAYALTADCAPPALTECTYRLHRRDRGQWFPLALRTSRRSADGMQPLLWVTGADVVTVLDRPDSGLVYASADAGGTVRSRPARSGPPIAAVPPDGVLDLASCAACAARLTVLEPTTGQLRPLAAQPPLGGAALRSVDSAGGAIWVVATKAGGATGTAVSTDGGRHWRAVPVPGFPAGVDNLRMTAGPNGSAYLLATRITPIRSVPVAEIWRIDGPGATWRRLALDPDPPGPMSSLPTGRGLLLTDYLGHAWRLGPDGAVARISDRRLAVLHIGPGMVATGPAGVLVGLPIGDEVRNAVLVSTDEGDSWTVEQVVG